MEELHKQIRRAKLRLAAERFLYVLGWCWVSTLSVAAALILLDKFWPLGVSDAAYGIGALTVGLITAAVWSIATSGGNMEAAIEIDRRFGLKERVSSAIALSEEERKTEIGQALLNDTLRRVKRVDVAEEIKPRPTRSLLYPLVPGLLALGLALFVSPAAAEKPNKNPENKKAAAEQIKKSAQLLQKKLAKRRQKAEQKGLKDAEAVFKLLEQGAKQLGEKNQIDQKKALVKLNDLSKELNKRRQKQGGIEKIKRQLGNLKGFKQGPADKFAKVIKHGDFNKAMQELDNLKRQLKSGKLDKNQQQQLANQLEQMHKKLAKMCNDQQDAQNNLQKKIDELRKQGKNEEANKLEELLDKLKMQAPQMEQLQKIAGQIQKCSKCLKKGDAKNAAKALNGAQKNLQGLQKQLDEMKMLDEAMEQLDQCRKGMCCKQCPGNKAGVGTGIAIDKDPSEEKKNFRDSLVRQQVGRGPSVIDGFVDGPNKKGQVGEEIKQQLDAAKHKDTDPLTDQHIPRKHRESVNGYFLRLRGEEP